MKIYKEKQYLIFDFEDGKTVKYDFATKTCIGKKGKPVVNLCSQLSGLTINQLCECCVDKQYGKFLKFIKNNGGEYGRTISNIGTVLDRVPRFARYEQIFSAGVDDIIDDSFKYTINDIPKSVIKLYFLAMWPSIASVIDANINIIHAIKYLLGMLSNITIINTGIKNTLNKVSLLGKFINYIPH